MPKVVDNYVLERCIGKGQFGEVFKVYNKQTQEDIAVKCVKRELLKGKFTELLENEINVLRTCNNDNIIKLYDIKKSINNIYLIIEYCNEGDLSQYIKQKKFLVEEEAVDYLLQILNGFKTLVKNKIMHRDFKLENILKHDGNIKIADFGFSKLLNDHQALAKTMLGSPLNKAPEVLNNQEYDNKADIWSIGYCFYELLFGKSPFTTTNMVELLENIKTQQFVIDRKVNNISPTAEDLLNKMLVVNPKDRISWQDLFNHEINFYQEEKLKKDLETALKGGEVMMNMRKFYIKNNLVFDHPADLKKKEDLNNFAIQIAQKGPQNQYQQYDGPILKKPQEENNLIRQDQVKNVQTNQGSTQDIGNDEVIDKETQREKEIKAKKRNANRILHERNIYVFLASVAEEAMSNQTIQNYDVTGFLLVKKLLLQIDFLKTFLQNKQNVYGLEFWEQFTLSKDYKDIHTHISKEFDVFKSYFDSIYEKLSVQIQYSTKVDDTIKQSINSNIRQSNQEILFKCLVDYLNLLIDSLKSLIQDQYRQHWVHADRVLDCIRLEETFQFEDKSTNQQFNFKQYYEKDNLLEIEALAKKVLQKFEKLK
ncbi:unnamed protein product (macronuclear) [Paramecium tetraurelia]|uniref:Protein kinase domain-containing protein n=1 Tax=Paramecium tetraurelia TaxID=5888 RepID=A0CIS4_PARTE|nr:uncharacterized protein GSPATT00007826001 [Paramecium tetraurelia]CAK70691.1 unnamed protein product [Paramecium tetraurelia]|eukprot:XP_001438088.1 hypothetical protein (macronuclear) [Paramecium tetraurelia strain d4-2]